MRINIKKTTFLWVITATIGLSSCKKFVDINDDPTRLKDPDASLILPAAQGRIGFTMGSDIHRFTSLWVQQFAAQGGGSAQPTQYDKYAVGEGDINNTWAATFAGTLSDLQKVIQKTEATSPKYSGVAKLLRAYVYQTHVDAYGDLPFSEANGFEAGLKPKYDSSSSIYDALIGLIDAGIADIRKASALSPTTDDLFYGGDMDKWERFGNALKLRIYIHYFSVNGTAADATKAKNGIVAVLATNKLFRNNADNFQMRFLTSANQTNPIHQFEGSRPNQFFPSKTLVDLMNAKNDARRNSFLTLFSGSYVGATNGMGDVVISTSFSRMSTYLRGKLSAGVYGGEAPIRMLTFAEQNQILAEYYARSNGGADLLTADTYYKAGITASFGAATEFSDGTEAAAVNAGLATYLASTNGTIAVGNAIQKIIEEKFVANFGVAIEPWTDWRRTGFPVLAPVSPATAIPRILPYSFNERSYNPNTPARPSVFTKTVFWDK
ncbi:SusD/RagB family nutrient-binding outer membrane lipoprotein [Pedobacter nanyangensis]|uniref:SusD/RagB family nutrient-binding outer membrane lipoprotein n=1 Tax=Pedobacter nanyangensis TaxID=1562389 RepID=UPI000DE33046|nr:SusD/RagB family nutrient-binding outer membrane lipoprotein [Pedobacter nanyangensis]